MPLWEKPWRGFLVLMNSRRLNLLRKTLSLSLKLLVSSYLTRLSHVNGYTNAVAIHKFKAHCVNDIVLYQCGPVPFLPGWDPDPIIQLSEAPGMSGHLDLLLPGFRLLLLVSWWCIKHSVTGDGHLNVRGNSRDRIYFWKRVWRRSHINFFLKRKLQGLRTSFCF